MHFTDTIFWNGLEDVIDKSCENFYAYKFNKLSTKRYHMNKLRINNEILIKKYINL